MIVKRIFYADVVFTSYIDFLPRYWKILRLWIETVVNCASAVAEMQLNDDPIQSVLASDALSFIIGVLIGIPSELFVSTVSVVMDDVLRAPNFCVDFFSDPRSFWFARLQSCSFHRCGSRRHYSSDFVWLCLPLSRSFRLSLVCFTSDFDWSAKLGVFTIFAIAALQPTIGLRS